MALMWSSLGAMLVLALWAMAAFLGRQSLTFSAGQWIVYVVWLLWLPWSVAFVWTSLDEGKSRAGGMGALIFGGVSALAAGLLARWWFV